MQLKSFTRPAEHMPRGSVVVRRADGLYITETHNGDIQITALPAEARAFAAPEQAQQFVATHREHPVLAGKWIRLQSLQSALK